MRLSEEEARGIYQRFLSLVRSESWGVAGKQQSLSKAVSELRKQRGSVTWFNVLPGNLPELVHSSYERMLHLSDTPLMEQQFVVTHTIRQTEISWLPDRLQTHLLSKCCIHKKYCVSLYFRKNMTCLDVGLLRICQAFFCRLLNCVLVGYDRLLFHERFSSPPRPSGIYNPLRVWGTSSWRFRDHTRTHHSR